MNRFSWHHSWARGQPGAARQLPAGHCMYQRRRASMHALPEVMQPSKDT